MILSSKGSARGTRLAMAAACAIFATGCPTQNPPDGGEDGLDAVDARDVGIDGGCPITGRDRDEGFAPQLGTGRQGSVEDFVPLAQGDTLYVVPGPQGLQHLLVGFRARGIDPALVTVTISTVRADDCVEVGFLRARLSWAPVPGETGLFGLATIPVTLADDNDRLEYCTTLGRDVMLVMDFDDGHMHRGHRELRIHVGGIDPNARPDQRQAWEMACAARDGGMR